MKGFTPRPLDLRIHQRTNITKGELQANIPVPSVWNWFNNVSTVDVINISFSGIGVISRSKLPTIVSFYFKSNDRPLTIISGRLRYETVHKGVYHCGVQIVRGHNELVHLLT